ncbi:MAG: DUF2382 domain-containing protein [Actinomycetota bacterium]|jgi:uncharacterized protein (TIGR02271 family)|nr:DUF2382 domain-containing protein [Actinomycetota bacterium]
MTDGRSWADRRSRDDADDGLVELTTVDESGVEVVRSVERASVGVERLAGRRVRLVKRVVVEQQVIELRREVLHIEEMPVTELVFPRDEQALRVGRDAPLEIVLSEEEAVVTKRVVPRERVRVFVDRIRDDQQVSYALRHEEIDTTGVDVPGDAR